MSPWKCGSECGSRPLCHALPSLQLSNFAHPFGGCSVRADHVPGAEDAAPSRRRPCLHGACSPVKPVPLLSLSRDPHLPTHPTDACFEPAAPSPDAVLGTAAQRGIQKGPCLQEAGTVCRHFQRCVTCAAMGMGESVSGIRGCEPAHAQRARTGFPLRTAVPLRLKGGSGLFSAFREKGAGSA